MKNKRVLFVEIETIDNGNKQLKQLDGIAIKGTVHRKMGSVQAEAKISIANLAQSDIEYLTTYTSPYFKPSNKKMINIYAGYEESGWGRIFSGDIIKAVPSDMPDIWLNIEAKSGFYDSRAPLSYGLTNSSMKELAQSIANNNNLAFDWQATTQKTISLNFSGGKAHLIKEYNNLGDVTMFEDNGVLKVIDQKPKPPENQNGMKVISKDSGMIGEPEPDENGVKVKCLLDASVACGKWVQIKSVKLPTINGIYQVYDLTFDFANRETQFYCNISAKRSGV